MIRSTLSRGALAAGLMFVFTAPLAAQQNKPAAKPAAAAAKPAASPAPAQGQPVQIASFGDWGVFASDTQRGRVCYALSQPKERLPKGLSRDPGYLFISTRPSEGIRNEISIITGFPTKDNAEGEMLIGSTKYVLVMKGSSAWLKNPAEDPAALETMKKGSALTAKTTSKKGNATTDRYSLSGLGQALDRIKKECP